MQTNAGTSRLAQTPQLSAHIPLTFSPKFKCEVRKITALYFQKIKNNNSKLKIIKKSTYNFRGNN